jgi:hypothetical protein
LELLAEGISVPKKRKEHLQVFANCTSFSKSQLTASQQFHEVGIESILNMAGKNILGFTVLFNFFCKVT